MDLATSTINGATSMSLNGDWDTKLPLNIEDSDISPDMKNIPAERQGLTSLSHCLWRYWVITQQRSMIDSQGKRLGSSWIVNKSLSLDYRRARVVQIEIDLNEKYLRFCDPIKSLDMLVLILARNIIHWWRRSLLCPGPAFKDAKDFTKEDKQALLLSSVQTLEYDIAIFTTASLEAYRWDWQFTFPWSPFVHVLLELRNQVSCTDGQSLWKVIAIMYQSSPELVNMDLNKRGIYIAGLTVDAWKYLQTLRVQDGLAMELKPDFVTILERYTAQIPTVGADESGQQRREVTGPINSSAETTSLDFTTSSNAFDEALHVYPTSFEDIDWMLWASHDGMDIFPGFTLGS